MSTDHAQGVAAAERSGPLGDTALLGLADESELWAARDTDPRAGAELAERYLAYAKSIALKFRSGSEPLDDLIQVASLGLVNAIHRFDPERGIPFIAFASPTITGELKRHFRDHASTMHIPRSLYDRIGKVDAVVAGLEGALNREPSVAEIASELNTDEHDVLEAVEASRNRHPVSLDRPSSPGDPEGLAPSDRLGRDDADLELAEVRLLLNRAEGNLSDHERAVLRLRFHDGLTQTEIAERIGRSQMHVSRLLGRILERLRSEIPGSPFLDG